MGVLEGFKGLKETLWSFYRPNDKEYLRGVVGASREFQEKFQRGFSRVQQRGFTRFQESFDRLQGQGVLVLVCLENS